MLVSELNSALSTELGLIYTLSSFALHEEIMQLGIAALAIVNKDSKIPNL